jgi:hypothetical protein
MSRIRLLLAWLVLAAIPLQGFAAASMLFCGSGQRQQSQVQVHASAGHDHAAHGHGPAAKVGQAADSATQLPDSSHQCGVCASCCHSAAITETPRAIALAPPPQSRAAEPFVLIHPRPSTVPDKPPRA